MNKGEFISFIAENENITKVEAEKIIDAFTRNVTKALGDKQEVQLIGFGNFTVTDIKARNGRNPRTGEVMKLCSISPTKIQSWTKT